MSAYYNEIEPFAAAWLRELMKRGVIEDGELDERDIRKVEAADLRGFERCHFFAGIGVWAYALRESGAEAKGVCCFTGSCPCQPFSVAGKRSRSSDERHLWPAWFALIRESRPELVFGEQVASDDGLAWLDVVSSDLENADYAIGTLDTCAAGFGAPILSQRLYFVGATEGRGFGMRGSTPRETGHAPLAEQASDLGAAASERQNWGISSADPQNGESRKNVRPVEGASRLNGFWHDAEWIACRDGFARPVEPGTFPLAHGIAGRVGRLRGYGNALVAPQAIEFVKAALAELDPKKR